MDRVDNMAFAGREDAPPGLLSVSDDEPRASDTPSLKADVDALISDGRTYLEAELAFQKGRAGFAAGRAQGAAVLGAGALAFVHLALIALVVGLVIALTTLVGPWFATAIVVLALLGGAAVLGMMAKRRVGEIRDVFEERGA